MIGRTFETLEGIPDKAVLLVNAGLGAFVLLAHGGALLLVLSGKVPTPPGYEATVRTMTPITLPIAAVAILSSLFGLVAARATKPVVAGQAAIVVTSAIALLLWAADIALHGIPAGNFAWTPGMLTGWVFYSGLLCSRLAGASWKPAVRCLVVATSLAALLVDLAVMARFLGKISSI